jgi:hypothetical protein
LLLALQRTFVGVEAFKVFQEVVLQPDEPRVCNVVEFGTNIGYLRVRGMVQHGVAQLVPYQPRLMRSPHTKPHKKLGLRSSYLELILGIALQRLSLPCSAVQ